MSAENNRFLRFLCYCGGISLIGGIVYFVEGVILWFTTLPSDYIPAFMLAGLFWPASLFFGTCLALWLRRRPWRSPLTFFFVLHLSIAPWIALTSIWTVFSLIENGTIHFQRTYDFPAQRHFVQLLYASLGCSFGLSGLLVSYLPDCKDWLLKLIGPKSEAKGPFSRRQGGEPERTEP